MKLPKFKIDSVEYCENLNELYFENKEQTKSKFIKRPKWLQNLITDERNNGVRLYKEKYKQMKEELEKL